MRKGINRLITPNISHSATAAARRMKQDKQQDVADLILKSFPKETPDIRAVDKFLADNEIDPELAVDRLSERLPEYAEKKPQYDSLRNSGSRFPILVLVLLLLSSVGRAFARQKVDLDHLDRKIDGANFGVPVADKKGEFRLAQDREKTLPLKNLFKEIARDSDEHAYIIGQCVDNVNLFVSTDLRKDKEFLSENRFIEMRSAGRSTIHNGIRSIILVDMFDDPDSLRDTVIHECLHVWQDVNDIIYSKESQDELDACVSGMRKALNDIVLCFDGKKKYCRADLQNLATYFSHHKVVGNCANTSLEENGAYPTIKISNSKYKWWNKVLLMKYEPIEGTRNLCLKYGIGMENEITKKRVLFSDDEKDLIHMANVLNNVNDRAAIAELYNKSISSRKTDKEIHAGFYGVAPTEMLNTVCEPEMVSRLLEESHKKGGGGREEF